MLLHLYKVGVVWIELECVPYKVAAEVTKRLEIPTIGIGSGPPDYDGQLLVLEDLLGKHDRHYPKHSKKYLDFYNDSMKALKDFKNEVENNIFPTAIIVLRSVMTNLKYFYRRLKEPKEIEKGYGLYPKFSKKVAHAFKYFQEIK